MAGALAVALAFVAFDFWRSTISAGPLSKHHASFGEQSCDSCHSVAEAAKAGWVANIAADHNQADSGQCLMCHVVGNDPTAPHSLAAAQLAPLQQAAALKSSASGATLPAISKAVFGAPDTLVCADCHFEHKGSDSDLVDVSNQQCAVCHQNSFSSLSAHAQFDNYPSVRRTAIIFDHNSHLQKHFETEKVADRAPAGCQTCHALDSDGKDVEVVGFENACQACHGEQVVGTNRASGKGLPMLSVPGLDVDTLAERGVAIGEWPDLSEADVTPLMLMLIGANNAEFAQQLQRVRELDLFDLSDASDDDLRLIYHMAWEIKRFYFNLQRQGASAIVKLLSGNDGEQNQQLQAMIGLLSPAEVDSFVAAAFPNLQAETETWLRESKPSLTLIPRAAPNPPPEVAAAPSGGASEEFSIDDLSEEFSIDDEGDEFSIDDEGDEFSIDDEGDAFSIDDEGDAFSIDDDEGGAFSIDDDDGADPFADDDDEASALHADDAPAANNVIEIVEMRPREDRVSAGGWYGEDFYLYYRPSGHADALIKSWTEFMLARSKQAGAIEQQWLKSFSSADNPGSCFKCHSIEKQPQQAESMMVNWNAVQSSGKKAVGFHRFSHQAHFNVRNTGVFDDTFGQGSCAGCHALDSEADSAASYQQMQATVFQSNFSSLDKDTCISCHAADESLQTCTQCHNYHVGERGFAEVSQGLDAMIGRDETSVENE
ncbi:MAG: hypothetical protein HKN50_04595 [Gammaproteobacteria bacterium]|nr:hypothetical protein [Gammaproteobacteria bacterium]